MQHGLRRHQRWEFDGDILRGTSGERCDERFVTCCLQEPTDESPQLFVFYLQVFIVKCLYKVGLTSGRNAVKMQNKCNTGRRKKSQG